MSEKTIHTIRLYLLKSLKITLIALFSTLIGALQAQFIATPPVQDGVISANEYGIHINGQNQETSAGGIWYMTWDANNLYFALTNSSPVESGVIYIDLDPIVPVNGGFDSDGSLNWIFDYDRTRLIQPVRSDFKVFFNSSYNEFRYSDGLGSWSANVQNALTTGANFITSTLEIVVPWNDVTNGMGKPTSFNWFGYKMYNNGDGDNGTYHPAPNWNPILPNNAGAGQVNTVYVPYYFSVINTDDNTSTKPFSEKSLTYHEDNSAGAAGGFLLGNKTLHDLTINDNSLDNLDNDVSNDLYDNLQVANRVLINGDVLISNNLFIARGSALLPADNVSGNVDVSITMNGSTGSIFNFGRLDCTPEVTNDGDWDLRRLNFTFDGTTTIEPTTLLKDRYRFSNIMLSANAELRASSAGVAEIELQYGTLDNNSVLNFNMGLTGLVKVGLRGESTQNNDYFFKTSNGLGSFIFNDLLIGRFSSKLQPSLNGGPMELQIRGNFENYGDFQAINGTGVFSVRLNGNGRQEIKGDVTETVGDRTVFQNLIIDNNNGNGNDNFGSDVHFVSDGGGQIEYFVNGFFGLFAGDLVTRDRVDPTIVHDLYFGDGAFIAAPGASSFSGLNNSSFIDGPVNYILINRPSITLEFPIGKDASYRNTLFTCFNQNTSDSIIYSAELFHQSAYSLNNTLPTSPELIDNISLVHYWNVKVNDPSYFLSAFLWIDYDQNFTDDGVTDPSNLRILQADQGGNNAWTNISVGTGGFGIGVGSILSNQFFSLDNNDFTLGNMGSNPLPIELIDFDAVKKGNTVELNWSTASEINNERFDILRSNDGVDFQKIESLPGAGDSNSILHYQTYDTDPEPDWNYYKLNQVDFDGTEWESEIKAVFFSANSDISIYPNPAISDFTISSADEISNVQIFNSIGEIVYQTDDKVNEQNFLISTENWASGIYLVQIISSNGAMDHQKVLIR